MRWPCPWGPGSAAGRVATRAVAAAWLAGTPAVRRQPPAPVTRHVDVGGVRYAQTDAHAGQTARVWWGVNLRGDVHYRIATKSGTNRAHLWWRRVPPFGKGDLGVRSGDGNVSIGHFSVYHELMADGFDSDAVILTTERADVALHFPPVHFP